MPELPHSAAAITWLIASGFVLLWDILLAGQIAQARRQSRGFLAVTALCGLLVAPAVLVILAAPSTLTGRAIQHVLWLWPLTLGLFVVQSGMALRRRLISSFLALPIFAANLVLFLAACIKVATLYFADIPATILGVEVAHTSALGIAWGREALWSPLAIQLPLLAPAYPARWRISKTVRAILSSISALTALVVLAEYAPGVRAAATFDAFANEALQERPAGDLGFGLRILPTLRGSPPAVALERDLSLADSLSAGVVLVRVEPSGARATALDSLNTAMAALRSDSVLLAVALGYDRGDAELYRLSPSDYRDKRLAALEAIMRRVRPDVMIPAADPGDDGIVAASRVGTGWWMDYLARASREIHRLRPRTRVAFTTSAFTPADSALYAWAVAEREIDIVGFSFTPTFGGGASLAARHRVARNWMSGTSKPHWVFATRSFPFVFGEESQEHAMMGTLAWSTRQPMVRTVVFEAAGDYDMLTGLRTAGGRLRRAVAALNRARRALDETAIAAGAR